MQSKAKSVVTYLREIPSERRPALEELRGLCKAYLADFEEGMEYGMPCYKRNGTVEVAFASQKGHISLYILKQAVMKRHATALAPYKPGKGCIKFPHSKPLDTHLLRALLEDTADSESPICGPRE